MGARFGGTSLGSGGAWLALDCLESVPFGPFRMRGRVRMRSGIGFFGWGASGCSRGLAEEVGDDHLVEGLVVAGCDQLGGFGFVEGFDLL